MAAKTRKIASIRVEAPTSDMVAELIADYAHTLDDGRIDLWPNFFTETALYHVTTRENHKVVRHGRSRSRGPTAAACPGCPILTYAVARP